MMEKMPSVCLSEERTPASPSRREGASFYQETLSKECVEIPRAEEGGGVTGVGRDKKAREVIKMKRQTSRAKKK